MERLTPDAMRNLMWSVVLILFLRAARVYGFVLLSANYGFLLRATVQIHAGTGAGSTKGSGRRVMADREQQQRREPLSSSEPNHLPRLEAPPSHNPTRKSPPPPYSPKSEGEPRPESILKLYEDIIASDAQTIQAQQDTMSAQQDTIRAQAQMIKNMRILLERQDEMIEDMERELEGRAANDEKQ